MTAIVVVVSVHFNRILCLQLSRFADPPELHNHAIRLYNAYGNRSP